MKIPSPQNLGYLLGLSLLMAACATVPAPGSQPTTMTPISPTAPAMTAVPSEEATPAQEATSEATPEATPEATEEATQPEANELADSQWTLESFGPEGSAAPVVGETPLTLAFSSDGQISGNGGCNSFGGSYLVEGDTLQVGEIISTLVACVDTALMEQETAYLDALQTVSQFQIDGDQLTITYGGEQAEQGTLIFTRADE